MIETPCKLTKSPKSRKPWTLHGLYVHMFKCDLCINWLKLNNPARHWRQEAKAWVADQKEGLKA